MRSPGDHHEVDKQGKAGEGETALQEAVSSQARDYFYWVLDQWDPGGWQVQHDEKLGCSEL